LLHVTALSALREANPYGYSLLTSQSYEHHLNFTTDGERKLRLAHLKALIESLGGEYRVWSKMTHYPDGAKWSHNFVDVLFKGREKEIIRRFPLHCLDVDLDSVIVEVQNLVRYANGLHDDLFSGMYDYQ